MDVEGKTGVRSVYLDTTALPAVKRYAGRWGITKCRLWRGWKGFLTGSSAPQIIRRLRRRAGVEHKPVYAFRRAALQGPVETDFKARAHQQVGITGPYGVSGFVYAQCFSTASPSRIF